MSLVNIKQQHQQQQQGADRYSLPQLRVYPSFSCTQTTPLPTPHSLPTEISPLTQKHPSLLILSPRDRNIQKPHGHSPLRLSTGGGEIIAPSIYIVRYKPVHPIPTRLINRWREIQMCQCLLLMRNYFIARQYFFCKHFSRLLSVWQHFDSFIPFHIVQLILFSPFFTLRLLVLITPFSCPSPPKCEWQGQPLTYLFSAVVATEGRPSLTHKHTATHSAIPTARPAVRCHSYSALHSM